MTTTRSQSQAQAQAMSTSQAAEATDESDTPQNTSSQVSIGSTPSQGTHKSTKSQESPLSPGWVHTITIILGHSLKSEIGQKLQKWVLYNVIDDPIDFWLHWDPSDPDDDITRIEKYVESNGSTVYLPNCTVKILISLWNYMDLLINQDKPEDQQDDKLYYVRDEQWTKLTAKDMRTALVNAKSEQRSSSRTLMPSFNTAPSTAPIRSPMTMELASFKKSIKREASVYSVLKDEHFFDKFQRDLLISAKSHDVSEILDPSYSPGHSPEERELFEAKQVFMYKVFNETLQTDMGRTTVRKYLRSTDAQAVWKEYSDYMTTSSKGASEKRKLTHYVTNTV